MKSNALVQQINALSNLIGPILAGFLYGFLGLVPVVIISVVGFIIAAIIELFLKIPHTRRAMNGGIFKTIASDFKEGINYVTKKKPVIFKIMLVATAINLFLVSMISVGLPYMIKITLGLSSQHFGFSEGFLGAGAIAGGFLVSILAKKLKIDKVHLILLSTVLVFIPVVFAVSTTAVPLISYGIICVCCFIFMMLATILNIQVFTYLQAITPNNLLGKVSSLIVTMALLAQPLGQSIYGVLFDVFANDVQIVCIITIILGLLVSFVSARVFSTLKMPSEEVFAEHTIA